MASVKELYAQHPEYEANGWSLEEFAQSLYQKHYAKDRTWDEFAAEAGLGQGGIGQQGDYPSQDEPGAGIAGFGYDNPEIAAEMGKKDWKPWLDEVGNALQGKIASGATFGVAPAIARRATGGESDKQLQRGTDILGKNLSFLLEGAAGIPTGIGAARYMPSALMKFGTETFNPGAVAAAKRIAGNTLDAMGIDIGNKAIGGELDSGVGVGDVAGSLWDSAKSAGTWGGALEMLLGAKRKLGTVVATKDMTPEQRGLDDAIEAVQNAIKKYGATREPGMETVTDLLGKRGPSTVNSLADVNPQEYANTQQAHADRLSQAPSRFRSEAERQAGGPLEDPQAIADRYKQQGVYQVNQQYVPMFERTPKIKKESIWVDPAEAGGKKERATVPAGMGKLLKDRTVFNMWQQANDRAKTLTKSYTDVAPRSAAGELETTWHTVLDMENNPDKAVANYGNKFKEILRTNHPELDTIVSTQSLGHSKSEAALTGQKVGKGKSSLLDTKARELTDPDPARAAEIQNALKQGYWAELARAADEGDKLPRSSTGTRRTAERVAGPTQGADFNEFLRRERAKVETDRAIANRPVNALPLEEPKTPKGAIARAASGVARVGIGAALGGWPQAVWGIPYLLNKLNVSPNAIMSKDKGGTILQLLRENLDAQTQPRKKNALETKGNVGALLPTISADVEDKRQTGKKKKREGYERSKDYLEGKD